MGSQQERELRELVDHVAERARSRASRYGVKMGRKVSGVVTSGLAAWQGVRIGRECRFYGVPRLVRVGDSRIEIGDRCTFRSARWANRAGLPRRVTLYAEGGGVIRIGDQSGLNGVIVMATKEIVIGDRVTVGAYVRITDSDWHGVNPDQRHGGPSRARPVHIEDDVFIGWQSIVLKGVTIGRGAVIGAGSVVTHDIPPMAVARGNPAEVTRYLDKPVARPSEED